MKAQRQVDTTANQQRIEAMARKLFNDQRAKEARETFQSYDIERIVDRLLELAPSEWSDATEALRELSGTDRHKITAMLESRAQDAARQARYLYLRLGPQGDHGHGHAVREQNKLGGKLHTSFGYDRSSRLITRF